jgi:hypothetical protein
MRSGHRLNIVPQLVSLRHPVKSEWACTTFRHDGFHRVHQLRMPSGRSIARSSFTSTGRPALPVDSIGIVKSLLVTSVFTYTRLPSTEMPSCTPPVGPNPRLARLPAPSPPSLAVPCLSQYCHSRHRFKTSHPFALLFMRSVEPLPHKLPHTYENVSSANRLS